GILVDSYRFSGARLPSHVLRCGFRSIDHVQHKVTAGVQNVSNGLGQRHGVFSGNEHACLAVLYDLRNSTYWRGDEGCTADHGFTQYIWYPFTQAGEHETVCRSQPERNLLVWPRPHEYTTPKDAEPARYFYKLLLEDTIPYQTQNCIRHIQASNRFQKK